MHVELEGLLWSSVPIARKLVSPAASARSTRCVIVPFMEKLPLLVNGEPITDLAGAGNVRVEHAVTYLRSCPGDFRPQIH